MAVAQNPAATPAEARLAGFEQRQQRIQQSIVNAIPFRNVGPTVMSGRVTDLAVNPANPNEFYVAYASGGLWHTTSNGTDFEPLFDHEAAMTIGDIAVNWDAGIIWVGTGENNSSRSSYAGTGLYKSSDGGQTWAHIGLPESHHIGRIVLHPTDPNTAWVAVLGHLYSPNRERGVYKTTDGGDSWKHTLFVHEDAGAVDLLVDPQNSNVLYAALWERTRRGWDFTESGVDSGIYRSEDGGETWSKLTTEASGFPTGQGVGRIGLAQYRTADQDILYAILDNQDRRPSPVAEPSDDLSKEDLRDMTAEAFLALDEAQIAGYLKRNRFPKKYSVAFVKAGVKAGTLQPNDLVTYLEDANALLFDTPVIGLEVYRSTDGGQTWQKTHKDYIDNVYNSYGYYFGQIRVAAYDPDKVYIMGVPILRSDDGGATFKSINGDNVHVDHHALWVNPDLPGHLINGNDGGVNISYDDGQTWFKCNSPAVGQFYAVNVDMAEPYNVYGGFQDNGVWVGPSTYRAGTEWHSTGEYPYRGLLGGDGMQVAIDSRDNNTVYTGFQFGYYYRINKATGQRKFIRPQHELGERPLRFNWQSPIHLSQHNQDILYFGANKVFRSLNQGEDLKAISDDLTRGGQMGDVPYGTLSSIHESSLQFGLIYVGSDDGLVHVSRDGGLNWVRISDGLPETLKYHWVSRVQASQHAVERVYLALNGYRFDDFGAYLFVSEDYGATWTAIGKDLPAEPINVVREDPENPNLLYVGTDHGLYVSLDRGATFMAMNNGLPAVAVHDLVIHPRDKDLVVGTHGRSIYIADVSHLQALTKEVMAQPLHAFEVREVRHSERWGTRYNAWSAFNTPEVTIPFYCAEAGKVKIEVADGKKVLVSAAFDAQKGLNYFRYGLQHEMDTDPTRPSTSDPLRNGVTYLEPGKYDIRVKQKKEMVGIALIVKK